MDKSIDKIRVVRAVISTIKDNSEPNKIQSKDLKEYGNPMKITLKDKKREFIPDLAVYYNNGVNLYEIELENKIDVEKWRLMSSYAKKFHGHLFLVVPDFLREKVKNELKSNAINAGLIYFNAG